MPTSTEPDGTTLPAQAVRRPFHGWRVVAYASVTVAMTAPGQTAGVSPFIDPVIRDLDMSRSAVSTSYMIGTLGGAALLPVVGRLIDRFGPRRAMITIAAVFGAVLACLSVVTEHIGLTAGFVGIRLTGQGALGLAAVTVVSYWFHRRRGTALGVVSALGFAGILLMPVAVERLIAVYDWRTVMLLQAAAVWAVVIPMAVFGIRDHPRQRGQDVDGDPHTPASGPARTGAGRATAVRTPYFWVLVAAVATSGLLNTALIFHQIDLLGEQGLTSAEAAANFLPQAAAGIAATVALGYLVDRVGRPQGLVAGSMALLAVGLVAATVVAPGWSAAAYGAAIGASANAIKAVEAALVPRMFGTAGVASIRSVVASVAVGATAAGPLLFAFGHDLTGSYTAVLLAGTVLPVGVIAAALLVRLPTSARPAVPTTAGDG